jgi:predicted porin
MKKSLIALAVLAASGAAMAQSSVTLYGVADAYVASKKVNKVTTNGSALVLSNQRQALVETAGLSGSRWGMKGSEDLGGGLNAVFTLEAGYNIDTGAAADSASTFNRQAFVGLSSNSFGTVALGRQYGAYDGIKGSFFSAQGNSPSFDATNGVTFSQADIAAVDAYETALAPTAAQATAAAAVLTKQAGRIGAWTGYAARFNNSVSYTTPSFSGFKGSVVYGFGENKTATTDATENISVGLSYANGPIGVALAYQQDELATNFKLTNTGIGGYYDFGVAKAFLSFNAAEYDGVDTQNEWAVGVRAPMGATTLVAQYAHSKGDDLGKNTSFGLSAEYSMSKRTTAYAAFNQTKVELADNEKNTIFALGVRHQF